MLCAPRRTARQASSAVVSDGGRCRRKSSIVKNTRGSPPNNMELRSVPDTSAASTTATLDPGEAIFAEVERGMAGMIEQHTAWLELCASGVRGEVWAR